ncbi:unnamed protein product, partial [Tetraodon nigroviridis]
RTCAHMKTDKRCRSVGERPPKARLLFRKPGLQTGESRTGTKKTRNTQQQRTRDQGGTKLGRGVDLEADELSFTLDFWSAAPPASCALMHLPLGAALEMDRGGKQQATAVAVSFIYKWQRGAG